MKDIDLLFLKNKNKNLFLLHFRNEVASFFVSSNGDDLFAKFCLKTSQMPLGAHTLDFLGQKTCFRPWQPGVL